MRRPFLAFLGCVALACSPEDPLPTIASNAAAPETSSDVPEGTWLSDLAPALGLTRTQDNGASPRKYMPESMGCGGALADFDGDGRLDVYLVNAHRLDEAVPPDRREPNRLYLRDAAGGFRDATEGSGADRRDYGVGCAVGDVDGDGDEDIFLANLGPNVLLLNDGRAGFTTAPLPVEGNDEWSVSAIFLDYDRDGDLDLFVVNYVVWSVEKNVECRQGGELSYCSPLVYPAIANRLYRNEGGARFRDVSEATGIAAHAGKGLGVSLHDFDGDGWVDIYVANDRTPNFLFRNVRGERFEEIGLEAGCALSESGMAEAGMGTDAADLDGDGRPDVVVTNFSAETNSAFYNLGDGFFEERSRSVGLGTISSPFVGFGCRAFDYENDGDLDVFVTNGHVLDNTAQLEAGTSYAQRDMLFLADAGSYRDVYADGVEFPVMVGRGLATGDLDDDGDLDLLVTNCGQPPLLLRNDQASGNAWIGLDLVSKTGVPAPCGASIRVVVGGVARTELVRARGSFLTAHDRRIVFGLGDARKVDDVSVIWPDGTRQSLGPLAVGRYHTVRQPAGR